MAKQIPKIVGPLGLNTGDIWEPDYRRNTLVYTAHNSHSNHVITPNWKLYAQTGLTPPDHPYNRTIEYQHYPFGTAKDRFNPSGPSYKVNWNSYSFPGIPIYKTGISKSYLRGKAYRKFYSKVKGTDFQALVTAAEMPKTLKLIASSALKLRDAIKSIKRADADGFAKALGLKGRDRRKSLSTIRRNSKGLANKRDFGNYVANTWLEVNYGWRPLLSDVENALQAQLNLMERSDADFRIRSSTSRAAGESDWRNQDDGHYTVGAFQVTGKFQVYDSSMRDYNAIGLTNLSSVVWEVIPYSFVVDWFFPIGSYVEALTALSGVKFLHGTETYEEYYAKHGRIPSGTLRGDWRTSSDIHSTCEYYRMSREVIQQLANPGVILSSKMASDAFTAHHVLTSLALMKGSFRI